MELWSGEFVSEVTFSKYCSFDSLGDVINPKLDQKVPKLVFHAPMVTEKWNSLIKVKWRWSIRFWNCSQNFEVSTPRGDIINPKVGQKAQTLVFQVSMLIERRKSKVKETLRWIICLWNRSLKILKFWLNWVTLSSQN